MPEKITLFEIDYITYKLGNYKVLNETEIFYHDMIMTKCNNSLYRVSTENIEIFTGELKNCLEFLDFNRMELFKCTIPHFENKLTSSDTEKAIDNYKEWREKK